MLEHYSAANFLNSKNTNRSLIFLEFILAGLLQCKKQTKNNAAAEKAFPDLERDHRLCTHYVAQGSELCNKQAAPRDTEIWSP